MLSKVCRSFLVTPSVFNRNTVKTVWTVNCGLNVCWFVCVQWWPVLQHSHWICNIFFFLAFLPLCPYTMYLFLGLKKSFFKHMFVTVICIRVWLEHTSYFKFFSEWCYSWFFPSFFSFFSEEADFKCCSSSVKNIFCGQTLSVCHYYPYWQHFSFTDRTCVFC